MRPILIQEHERLNVGQDSRFDNLHLVRWDKPMDYEPWGYYASYVIGAEWIDENEALVVTTKRGMEEIDFLAMFMTCFSSNLSADAFSQIYTIDSDAPVIYAPSLKGIISPLIVLHFLAVVSRIKSLKKGYVHYSGNLKKVKGRINVIRNERTNMAIKRFDRVFCEYDEYTVDIPENKLIKKALLFCKQILRTVIEHHKDGSKVKQMLLKSLLIFERVSEDVQVREVTQIKAHKLFNEYSEAVRLAKLILRRYDFSISKTSTEDDNGLLHDAYGDKVLYQVKGRTGYPDFLYKSHNFKAILDTKYIPKYDESYLLDNYVVRQLSGYSRDLPILQKLGYNEIDEESPLPDVPCIIIYPKERDEITNPFSENKLQDLCRTPVRRLMRFYKICIPLPVVAANL